MSPEPVPRRNSTLANNFSYAFDPVGGFDPFYPVLGDNFVPAAPSQLLKNGNFSRNISTIIGWTEDDGSIFVLIPDQFVNSSYIRSWAMAAYSGLNKSTVDAILSLYPANSSTFTAKREAYPTLPVDWLRASQIERDLGFGCPALSMAQAMSQYNDADSNTSIYIYSLSLSLFTPLLAAENVSFDGVTHGSDIPYVFNQAISYNATQEQAALASQVSGSWIQFAYNGQIDSPESVADPTSNLTLLTWPTAVNRPSSAGQGDFAVKVIDVAGSSVVEVGRDLDQDKDYEELGRRCAFWSLPEILQGLGE